MSPPQSDGDWETLFRAHYAMLVAVSERLTNDRALSEDVVQQLFVRLMGRGPLRNVREPAAYLRRAVVTRTINALKQRKRLSFPGEQELQSAIEHFAVDEPDDLAEARAQLLRAIEGLPDRAKLILKLQRFEGMSYKEIAEALELSPKTVENQLARALKLLRNQLVRVVVLTLLEVL